MISEEIDTGNKQKCLWTKAFSEADGEDNKTKALYIKYRFDQLFDELLIDEEAKIKELPVEDQPRFGELVQN